MHLLRSWSWICH